MFLVLFSYAGIIAYIILQKNVEKMPIWVDITIQMRYNSIKGNGKAPRAAYVLVNEKEEK